MSIISEEFNHENRNIDGEEVDSDYSNDDLYQIKSWGADLSFRELIQMYHEEELIKPELQRNYVWEKKSASRFIESILLGLPIPSIFLATDDITNNKLIIDGFQRLMTVYDYVHEGIWRKTGEVFKLTNSKEINPRWAGKSFKELETSDQKKIRSTTIHTIIFEQTKPKDNNTSLFQIFERINTGGRTLTPQEIRNCVSQGPLNTLLFELNSLEEWRILWGKNDVDNRMKDMEYILRFFYLYEFMQNESEYTEILMKKELNIYMKKSENQEESKISQLREIFTNTMKKTLKELGKEAFYKTTLFNATVFDSISVSTAFNLHKNIEHVNLIKNKEKLLADELFIKYSTERTTRVENIRGRINKAFEILYNEQPVS